MIAEARQISFELAQETVGETFSVRLHEDGQEIVKMRLAEVMPIGLPHALCVRPFSLMFEGPVSTPFDQGTYFFSHPQIAGLPIFIVPIAQTADIRKYQAIFN